MLLAKNVQRGAFRPIVFGWSLASKARIDIDVVTILDALVSFFVRAL
jgi:hypothetical protein